MCLARTVVRLKEKRARLPMVKVPFKTPDLFLPSHSEMHYMAIGGDAFPQRLDNPLGLWGTHGLFLAQTIHNIAVYFFHGAHFAIETVVKIPNH